MEYNDAARNQTKLTDPSAGAINYTYDSFGRVKTQTDARNRLTTYTYLPDGRINTRVTIEGTTTYSYNTNKQLLSISSPGGVGRTYGYDPQGRVTSISETISGAATPFLTTFAFDSFGRLSTLTHPSGIMETRGYNSYGYMATISAEGSVRYTITGMNAREQLTAATYGSNLTATYGFDAYGYPSSTQTGTVQDYRYVFEPVTGNLTSRENYLRGNSESFTYDNLDRLLTATGPQNLTMTYTANGNLDTKSDIGTTTFGYGTNAGPYALTGVTTSTNIIPEFSQTISYNSFGKISSINEPNGSQTINAFFTYNSDNQRAKMFVGVYYGAEIMTRYYVGGSYMKEVQPNTINEYTYLGGDAYTAPVVVHNARGVKSYYYLLRDHLGNITHQVNTSNAVVAEFSFDAWGRRRNATNWSYTLDANDKALFADRGFTGHEYLSWFKLYNMNGRLYDPAVGRFLNADPYVQMPNNTQSYNRYSYGLNNPLKYTDPSGNKWKWKWINPLYWFEQGMQAINDNTEGLRDKMVKAGVPDFNVGMNVNLNGNVNYNGSYNGQQVFNTQNIDRSGISVQNFNKDLNQVIYDYRDAWYGTSWKQPRRFTTSTQALESSALIGFIGLGGDLASMSNSSFRLMSGVEGTFSPKIYSSGWNGGSPARITTYSLSKVATSLSFKAGVVTTYMAYNDIYEGKHTSMTYMDAGVGTVGVVSSLAYYYSGIEIPYVGEAVFLYGTARLTWDVFYYLGANYGPIGAYYGTNKWSGR